MTNLFQYDLVAQDAEMKELTDKFEDAHDHMLLSARRIAFKLVNVSKIQNQDRAKYTDFGQASMTGPRTDERRTRCLVGLGR